MKRLVLAATAAAVLLTSGCGGPHSTPTTARGTTPTVSVTSPPAGTTPASAMPAIGTVRVIQQGATPARSVWSVRLEDMTAKPQLERSYPGKPIALVYSLPVGTYRVMAWSRPCEGRCPATGEAGLGPLGQVCGAQVEITVRREVKAAAVITPDGNCSFKISK
ncbi:MAG: hypothetical protein HOV83_26735 [Catenulispora sp.]|nr:hypothetical protein [Catenulispora sp.]